MVWFLLSLSTASKIFIILWLVGLKSDRLAVELSCRRKLDLWYFNWF